jgi:release factor glutamine methyltransferase
MQPISIREQLLLTKQALSSVTAAPLLEAEILLSYVLDVPRHYLYTRNEELLPNTIIKKLMKLINRRCHKEPIAYITGKKEFWSLNLTVNPHVLIPRPETESLVECVLMQKGDSSLQKVADLGTGSGAIALALASEHPDWHIYATDISFPALQLAEQNAKDLKLPNVSFYQGEWCAALPSQDFDVIVSNPPYIAQNEWPQYADDLFYEPTLALLSGEDGLDAIRHLIYESKNYLKPKGCLFIEHGFSQGTAVREIFKLAGYQMVESVKDISGHERITWGSLSSFL